MDYAPLRRQMVNTQLIPRGINGQEILDAFYKVERHKFIPQELSASAYVDHPLAIGEEQTISQPYIAALMTQHLNLSKNDKILEIGTGSGYQTAILAELSGQVYTIERLESLSAKAGSILNELGYTNIKIQVGDGTLGWDKEAPFDKIVVTAAGRNIPEPLIKQLNDPGKLIMPIGESYSQILTLAEKKKGRLIYTQICGCVFVPLIGKYAN